MRNYNISPLGQALGQPATISQSGGAAYNNSYRASSVRAFGESENPNDLVIGNSDIVKPEQITSFEVGYRGKLGKITVDASAYYNQYKDFISGEVVIAPFYGTVGDQSLSVAAIANGDFQTYQTYTNTDADVNSYGGSIGLTAKVFNGFDLSGSYTNTQQDFDRAAFPDFLLSFNTPEHRAKVSFAKEDLFKNFGFNVAWRWSDTYYWEATFGSGIIPAYQTVDAQINLRCASDEIFIQSRSNQLNGSRVFYSHRNSRHWINVLFVLDHQ